MTREEAISIIRKMLACTDLSVRANLTADMVDACHLAIKALEQEPTTKNDSLKYCDRSICLRNEYNNVGCEDCEVTKSQEPTTKNDLGVEYISRAELMAILSDYYDTTIEYRSMLKEIASLSSITPQEPVIDKIRAEIKQYQSDYDVHGTEYDRVAWKAFNRCLQIIDKYKTDRSEEQTGENT